MSSDRVMAGDNQRPAVQVIVAQHRLRAEIAMAVAERGGHAETYEDVSELLAAKPKAGTALVSSDLGTAAQILSQFQASGLFLPLVLFAENPSPSQIVRAIHEGAANYLSWPFTGEELLSACTYCQTFMEVEGSQILRQQQAKALVDGLSGREKQVLAFLLDGHSNKSMAKALDLSPRTIEDYRLSTLKKLGVQATSAAIRLGLEAGLQVQYSVPASQPAAINQPLL